MVSRRFYTNIYMSEIMIKRTIAYLIDMIVVSFPFYLFMLFCWRRLTTMTPGDLLTTALWIQFLPFLIYFFISETYFEKTIGKKIMDLKVVAGHNRFASILKRTICRLIPLDLITFIFFKDRLLHDYLSTTKVIYK